MHRLGLALSGGGFRATLYHLGVVRFLRDAGILPKITHLTTVSGGSILGAHLVLNWDKYCGTEEEFQEVADQIVRFVQLDVRNRIVRRFPFASLLNTLKRIFRFKTSRKLTRAGLLEWYYERFLYGEIPLSQLPERPQLHILATNVVLAAMSETSPVYRRILNLLKQGPGEPIGPAPYEEVETIEKPDFIRFEVVSDTRIYDFRGWSDAVDSPWLPHAYLRSRVRRKADGINNERLHIPIETVSPELFLLCRNESLAPTLTRMTQPEKYSWDLALDFSHVPLGGYSEVVLEATLASEIVDMTPDGGRFIFSVPVDTGLVEVWMLMPEGRQYDYFEIIGHPIGNPEQIRTVEADTKVELPLGSLVTFRFVNPADDYHYECQWKWSGEAD